MRKGLVCGTTPGSSLKANLVEKNKQEASYVE
jgi:hypothetical protein